MKEEKSHNDKMSFVPKNIGLLFMVVVLFVIIAPYVFTHFCLFTQIDFSNTGSIGDTIGGITAPIINVFAALLVYLAFKEQVRANEIQIKSIAAEKDIRESDLKFNTTLAELNWCSDEYGKIQFKDALGIASIDLLAENRKAGKASDSEVVLMFQKILGLKNYLSKMETLIESMESNEHKAILGNKLAFVYRSYTRKYKSKILQYSDMFSEVLGKNINLEELLLFDEDMVERLEN